MAIGGQVVDGADVLMQVPMHMATSQEAMIELEGVVRRFPGGEIS